MEHPREPSPLGDYIVGEIGKRGDPPTRWETIVLGDLCKPGSLWPSLMRDMRGPDCDLLDVWRCMNTKCALLLEDLEAERLAKRGAGCSSSSREPAVAPTPEPEPPRIRAEWYARPSSGDVAAVESSAVSSRPRRRRRRSPEPDSESHERRRPRAKAVDAEVARAPEEVVATTFPPSCRCLCPVYERVADILREPCVHLDLPPLHMQTSGAVLRHVQSLILARVAACTRFKVGATKWPAHRWTCEYGYVHEGFTSMLVVFVTESLQVCAHFEAALIGMFELHQKCVNVAPGGENLRHSDPPHFVYCVFA